jgi:hypothetical protein
MALPTTDRYPFLLQAAVPDDLAVEVYSLAWTRGEQKSTTLRAVIEAGLAALKSDRTPRRYHARPKS